MSDDRRYEVARLPADATLGSDWLASGPWLSMTRTADELSLVGPEGTSPPGARVEPGWRLLRVRGALDFAMTGVLAALAAPLADAEIPIFVVSTFDTDYLLLKDDDLEAAVTVLREHGHEVDVSSTHDDELP